MNETGLNKIDAFDIIELLSFCWPPAKEFCANGADAEVLAT